jgi:hypothetical protein
MNGQPPPPPSGSIPPSSVPPVQPAATYYPPPRSGMGCFAKGCLTILVLGGFFLAAISIGGWFIYKKTVNNLTSYSPGEVRVEPPTPDQVQTAEATRTRLDEAIARNQETTIELTGPELNYLLSRDPDLDFLRGRTRIEIAESTMTVALSAPLTRIPWPGLKGRWFNGTVRFTMTYASGEFQCEIISAEANGNEFPSSFLSSFTSSFNQAMNEAFQEAVDQNNHGRDFWTHVKTMSLQNDKLIIVTKPK